MHADKLKLPFRATQSEERIVRELLHVGSLRFGSTWQHEQISPVKLDAMGFSTCSELITYLQQLLFPHEHKLRNARKEKLSSFQTQSSSAQFDETLETPTIRIQGKISTVHEFEQLKEMLATFNFAEWLAHCNSERIHAD